MNEAAFINNADKFKTGSKVWKRYRNQTKPKHMQKEFKYMQILKRQGIKYERFHIREGEYIPECFYIGGVIAEKPITIFQF